MKGNVVERHGTKDNKALFIIGCSVRPCHWFFFVVFFLPACWSVNNTTPRFVCLIFIWPDLELIIWYLLQETTWESWPPENNHSSVCFTANTHFRRSYSTQKCSHARLTSTCVSWPRNQRWYRLVTSPFPPLVVGMGGGVIFKPSYTWRMLM